MNERPGREAATRLQNFCKVFLGLATPAGERRFVQYTAGDRQIKHEEYTCYRFSITTPKCLLGGFCPIPEFLSLLLDYHLFSRFYVLVCATPHQRSVLLKDATL